MLNELISDLKNLNYKNLDYEEGDEGFDVTLSKIETGINSINKNTKKSIMSIDLIKEELELKNNEIFKLNNEIKNYKTNNIKIYKKILLILDQIDYIYSYAEKSENDNLLNSLKMIKKIINKEIADIGLVEIKATNELFNPKIHRCISTIEDKNRKNNEIVSVIENGYMLNGEVLRVASVIVVK